MEWDDQRRRMVADQLIQRGIRDPKVLAAFAKVPRHLFVPPGHRADSYSDHPVPIGAGQTISQPYIVALMTQELRPRPGGRLLDVGTGSGYQTAILAEIGSFVCSVERIPELAEGASKLLKEMGYANVEIRVGDGSLGWPTAAAPRRVVALPPAPAAAFEGILVTAAASAVPQPLLDQLAEGGRLIIPLGSALSQTLTLIEREGKQFQSRPLCDCLFVPLIGGEE
ncbi:MAG: protein-L-isoaspartate(D-aspartate) O-methyltransferase [Candidatus Omnitrophica bacterium]|nr:protein-L-isoaspartate(D-aspartate) O-methyltransferase [Candidatus Omnitrophota bacterium]